jgi:hypothetical protein
MNFDHRLATMTVCMEAAKILYTWDLSSLDKAEILLTNYGVGKLYRMLQYMHN